MPRSARLPPGEYVGAAAAGRKFRHIRPRHERRGRRACDLGIPTSSSRAGPGSPNSVRGPRRRRGVPAPGLLAGTAVVDTARYDGRHRPLSHDRRRTARRRRAHQIRAQGLTASPRASSSKGTRRTGRHGPTRRHTIAAPTKGTTPVFTGIVEELGRVADIEDQGDAIRLGIGCELAVSDAKLGDSIAVNGVCLTVAEFDDEGFTADVMQESLDRTSLGGLAVGRPSTSSARGRRRSPSGHIVQGHVDGTARSRPARPASTGRSCASRFPTSSTATWWRRAPSSTAFADRLRGRGDDGARWFEVNDPDDPGRHRPGHAHAAPPSIWKSTWWPSTSRNCCPDKLMAVIELDSVERAIADRRRKAVVRRRRGPGERRRHHLRRGNGDAGTGGVHRPVLSGYICAPLTGADCDRLGLPPMVARNQDVRGTAYTVTVDAATGRPASPPPTARTPSSGSRRRTRRPRSSPAPATSCRCARCRAACSPAQATPRPPWTWPAWPGCGPPACCARSCPRRTRPAWPAPRSCAASATSTGWR